MAGRHVHRRNRDRRKAGGSDHIQLDDREDPSDDDGHHARTDDGKTLARQAGSSHGIIASSGDRDGDGIEDLADRVGRRQL